jgi:predicted nucleotidyltransferase
MELVDKANLLSVGMAPAMFSMMIDLVENQKQELSELCQRYRVERLDIFGSATSGAFDPGRSDLDFLVRFGQRRPTGEYADRYLGFADALEKLFQRPVDLLTEESIRNPFFQREVEATRRVVYEQPNGEAAL